MDLRQLEYFLCVEECGSFTAAAEWLHIAQPSLSRQIRLLEVELRHHLFIRHGRGVIPTEAGKLLAEQAKMILRQVDLTRESLDRMHPGTYGHLAIGIPSSLVTLLGVPLLTEFRNRLPGVSLSISDGLSNSMQEWLLSGRLDIALLYKPLPSSGISSISVMEEELFLFSHASSKATSAPITMTEVAQLPLILPRNPHEIRMLVETHMASLGYKPKIALEVDSVRLILHFLIPGEQFTILPRYAVSIYAKPNTYTGRRIINPELCSKLVLATAAKRPADAKRATNVAYDAALKLMAEICGSVLEPIKASASHA